MDLLYTLFGEGKDLNALQMSCRGIAICIITLLLLRISGRRSFGMRMPLDNLIVILLGAVMSRAVVGASPFVPVICCSLIIVLFHRALAWLSIRNPKLRHILHGRHILLFDQGKLCEEDMKKALVSKDDLEQAVRTKASADNLNAADKMFMEHNGEISVIKKES